MAREYPEPWVPKTFSAWIKKHTTNERSTDRATGEVVSRPVYCWDLEGRADGVQWLKRFRKAGLAQTWKGRMEADFAAGLPFDLRTKQFVVPQKPGGPGCADGLRLDGAVLPPTSRVGAGHQGSGRPIVQPGRWLLRWPL